MENHIGNKTEEYDLSVKMTKDLKTLENGRNKSCKQCGYSATKVSSLKIHLLVHSGEKHFSCNQCEYSCARAGDLKTHMLTHSGEKPFSCRQCEFSCTKTGNQSMLVIFTAVINS